MNRTFKPNRQGITLLFVVSMIVLFLLLGTAFVVVANNFNRESTRRILSNQVEGKGELQGNELLEEAMFQVIRGPDLRNVDSPLRSHDLLADQYGYGVRAFVSRSTAVAPAFIGGETFIQLALDSRRDADPGDMPNNMCFDLLTLEPRRLTPLTPENPGSLDNLNGTFGGRVLSFVSGPAKGFSVRIMADAFTSSGTTLRFSIPATSVNGDIITATDLENLAGSEVIINGRDFSGGTNRLGLVDSEARLLNLVGQPHADLITMGNNTPDDTRDDGLLSEAGFSNEPWDAADLANPFLSGFDSTGRLIPSFYRQETVNFFGRANPNFLRNLKGRYIFHAFDENDGSTGIPDGIPDVDTNNDGIPDAFWMDLGMSIATNSNGQRFKPLFAIHIIDMDGRLNVNAHGNITHTRADGFVESAQTFAGGQPNTPRGLGMGPPDVDFANAFNGDRNKLQEIFNGRYGPDGLPGNGMNSFRSRAKLFGHPTNAQNPVGTTGGLYSTAMDINGRFRIGTPAGPIAGFGDPNFPDFNNSLPQIDLLTTRQFNTFFDENGDITFDDEFTGNPYEMSLNGDAAGDTPFTVEELERLLRPDDIDSLALPNRLSSIIDVNPGLFTTHSFDVPMLNRSFPEEIDFHLRRHAARGRVPQLTDMQRVTLINEGLNMQRAFAPELYFGLKMDINRPFGDGIDNDAIDQNGDPINDADGDPIDPILQVVDDPGETTRANNTDALGVFGTTDETEMDLDFGLDGNANGGASPREIYARNLYMLAMLLLDPVSLETRSDDDDTDVNEFEATPSERRWFARTIAQWAINVVDFRDADSIHTRFVYDPEPFTTAGWAPDGNDFVWGCERPELLLTETLAVHIQNFQDLDLDPDERDWQQRLRPEPFAYFEVYNPWTQNRLTQKPPAELYDDTGTGVDLGKLAPDGSPIWRFEIERLNDTSDITQGFKPLRYVYMADPTNSNINYNDPNDDTLVPDDIVVLFGTDPARVRPGGHALIGTQGFPNGNNIFEVFMGRKNTIDATLATTGGTPAEQPVDRDNLLLNETTRLSINVTDMNTGEATVTRFTGSTQDSFRETSIVFVDQASLVSQNGTADPPEPRKFSLTDPKEGYPDMDSAGMALVDIPDGAIYPTPFPTPLDRVDGEHINAEDLGAILPMNAGITPNFRFIRLQRLANPLVAWDANTNPYLTIDTMEADLISFNGADENVQGFPPPGINLNPVPFRNEGVRQPAVSNERLGDQQTSIVNDDIFGGNNNINNIWRHQRRMAPRNSSAAASTDHFFARAFTESLGQTNDAYMAFPDVPFPLLTWNNRPFVSHLEIMNVPYLSPDRFTYIPPENLAQNNPELDLLPAFGVDDRFYANPYGDQSARRLFATRLSGRHTHLLNFYGAVPEDDPNDPEEVRDQASIFRILDFLEVPSRFAGTESWYLSATGALQHPFNTIPHYRVPGKINLNTIPPTSIGDSTTSLVWDALAGDYNNRDSGVDWEEFKNSLYGNNVSNKFTVFENPFRPAAANAVHGVLALHTNPVRSTLLRSQNRASGRPLFDYVPTNRSNDSRNRVFRSDIPDNESRSPAFQNAFRTRLANLTTTKSSVFACWITVGFFEVDLDGNLIDTSGQPLDDDNDPSTELDRLLPKSPAEGHSIAEIGAESGEQVRHRGFFLFDRSLPVAYEPGKNHNVDKAILLKTIIE